MTIEILLFILRVLAGLCLAGILTALFVIVWRDYQQAVAATQSIRRVYGQLVKLAAINTEWIETGDTYPLLQLTTFGRAPTNTILLEDTFASGEHAQIALRNGQWWLEDRNSRNGTLLNGEKITMPIIVTSGDVIGIGNISFRLMLQ